MQTIAFTPLAEHHFPLLVKWLNEPTVKEWYSQEEATLQSIAKKMMPRLHAPDIQGFIISIDAIPVGFIQVYDARKFPREGYDLQIIDSHIKHIEKLASIDFYIGNPEFRGKGLGAQILKQFLHNIVLNKYDACFADPDVHNIASIKSFEKAGFKAISEVALDGRSDLIMLYEKF